MIAPLLMEIVYYVSKILTLLIIIRAVLTFFPQIDPRHPLIVTLDKVVDPILRPFQRVLPAVSGLDFSPIFAMITIQLVASLLMQLIGGLLGGPTL